MYSVKGGGCSMLFWFPCRTKGNRPDLQNDDFGCCPWEKSSTWEGLLHSIWQTVSLWVSEITETKKHMTKITLHLSACPCLMVQIHWWKNKNVISKGYEKGKKGGTRRDWKGWREWGWEEKGKQVSSKASSPTMGAQSSSLRTLSKNRAYWTPAQSPGVSLVWPYTSYWDASIWNIPCPSGCRFWVLFYYCSPVLRLILGPQASPLCF